MDCDNKIYTNDDVLKKFAEEKAREDINQKADRIVSEITTELYNDLNMDCRFYCLDEREFSSYAEVTACCSLVVDKLLKLGFEAYQQGYMRIEYKVKE